MLLNRLQKLLLKRRIIGVVTVMLIIAIPLLLRNEYYQYVCNIIVVSAIIAIGVSVIMRTGRLPLATAAVVGLGAYSTSILITRYGLGFWTVVPVATIMGLTCGFVLGALSLRLAGFFFAIATVAFNEMFFFTARHIKLTGGEGGITGVPSPGVLKISALTIDFGASMPFYFLLIFFLILSIYIAYRMKYSSTGSAITALGEDEILAKSCGIDNTKYRLIACVLGSGIAGTGGCLHAYLFGGAAPTTFATLNSVTFLLMTILGGPQFVAGPIVGAAVLTMATVTTNLSTQLSYLLYGAIFFVVIYLAPDGIISRGVQLVDWLGKKSNE